MTIKPIKDDRYKSRMVMPFIRFNTLMRLKAVFPCTKGESMSSYFNRLAVHLEILEDLK